MSTPHNKAEKGQIAKTALMPGDPLRAKFIAETFLENPVLFNDVRGMLGYTGTYQGKQVSVMGSGMGMPSIGIYSHELYAQYGVENIIRSAPPAPTPTRQSSTMWCWPPPPTPRAALQRLCPALRATPSCPAPS